MVDIDSPTVPAVPRVAALFVGVSALVAIVLSMLVPSGPLAASADDDADADVGAPTQAIVGELTVEGEPLEGVLLLVRRDGAAIGEDLTDADGRFRIAVPEGGVYEVELDVASLPEGAELRDPDRNVLDNVRVSDGREQRVRFAFDDAPLPTVSGFDRLANATWNGIKFGAVVALASLGLSLIFGTTGLVNFAHAEAVTFGAIVTWFFNSRTVGPSLPLVVAAVLGLLAAAVAGAGLRSWFWRPLERRGIGLVSLMVVSIGLGLALRHLFGVVYGTSPRTYAEFAAQRPWNWGPLVFPPKDLVLVPLALGVLALVAVALQRTRLGTAVRAVSDNRDLASSSGIDVGRVVLVIWIVGTALAGLGGTVFGITQSVNWDMGFSLLLLMFAAVILGGIGSVYGPMLGGLVVGLATELSTLWFSAEFKTAWALAVLILVLLVRPQGVLGRRERVG